MLKIIPFSDFIQTVKKYAKETNPHIIEGKNQLKYLKNNYFGKRGLNATHILIEEDYVSQSYLTDYSQYYSLTFGTMHDKCTRFHFFSSDDEETLRANLKQAIIDGEHDKIFWADEYLGFMVINPIRNAIVGFTNIKHYNYTNNESKNNHYDKKREFFGVKEFKVHIFGKEVILEGLPYREQDQNVSACATIGIWSMLQSASKTHAITPKAPSELTALASNSIKPFPNKGLDIPNIYEIIKQCGLEAEISQIWKSNDTTSKDKFYVHRLVRAYAPMEIPMLVTYDDHLVVVSGYKWGSQYLNELQTTANNYSRLSVIKDNIAQFFKTNINPKSLKSIAKKKSKPTFNPPMRADLIEKLYLHDDQQGLYFKRFLYPENIMSKERISTMKDSKFVKKISEIVIPITKKVRIDYDDIADSCLDPLFVLGSFISFENNILKEDIKTYLKETLSKQTILDIKLMPSEAYKQELLEAKKKGCLNEKYFEYLVINTRFPKYIWVVSLQLNDKTYAPLFDFVYDAGGLRSNKDCEILHTIFYKADTIEDESSLIDTWGAFKRNGIDPNDEDKRKIIAYEQIDKSLKSLKECYEDVEQIKE